MTWFLISFSRKADKQSLIREGEKEKERERDQEKRCSMCIKALILKGHTHEKWREKK